MLWGNTSWYRISIFSRLIYRQSSTVSSGKSKWRHVILRSGKLFPSSHIFVHNLIKRGLIHLPQLDGCVLSYQIWSFMTIIQFPIAPKPIRTSNAMTSGTGFPLGPIKLHFTIVIHFTTEKTCDPDQFNTQPSLSQWSM